MATDVLMPQMGADMEEGTLLHWLKRAGEHVARGEVIAEIETDKANVEIESFEEGVLTETLVEEGQVVPVGQAIARIGRAGETGSAVPAPAQDAPTRADAPPPDRPAVAKPPPPPSSADREGEPAGSATAASDRSSSASCPDPAPATAMASRPSGTAPDAGGRVRISPVARNLARELGVDVELLHGSGPDGRVMRKDVEAAAQAGSSHLQEADTAPRGWSREVPATPDVTATEAPAATQPSSEPRAAPDEIPAAPAQPAEPRRSSPTGAQAPGQLTPLSRMRQAIARRMAQSKREAPHYYVTAEIDMTEAMRFRASINDAGGDDVHVTVNDLIVKACAEVLHKYPPFNAFLTEGGLQHNDRINVCIGIALSDGLIAPALLDVGDKSLGAIAREAHDLGERARANRLRPAELNNGTFTISNLGMYGIETLIPIIQPPQSAILGVGAVQDKPAVFAGEIVIRQLMMVALAADHRVTDGAQGGEFLRELKHTLEHPVTLAL